MLTAMRLSALTKQPRQVARSAPGDEALERLNQLPGRWRSVGQGWNMIALPFVAPGGLDYRSLLNQYDEQLNFTFVDKAVPNRGISEGTDNQTDQFIVALDYEQVVHQVESGGHRAGLIPASPVDMVRRPWSSAATQPNNGAAR